MPSGYKHDNPKKALVRGTISYLESQGLPVNKRAIFRHFELTRSQGYAALNPPASKRGDPEWEDTRGRPSKISEEDIRKMEALLWDAQYDSIKLTWEGLAKRAAVTAACSRRTVNRAMGTMGYRLCLTRGCGRQWTHESTRQKRLEWAQQMLGTMPFGREDWRSVRFSGELHFGFGLDGRMRLLPRPGEKHCPGCLERGVEEWPKDIRRVHAWGAIGHGFKSELVFYEESVSPNVHGVMTMVEYKEKILERVVKGWLKKDRAQSQGGQANGSESQQQPTGQPPKSMRPPSGFILAEDADTFARSSSSKNSVAQKWKEDNALRHLFNCGDSPDLNPLDAAALWPAGGTEAGGGAKREWVLEEPVEEWEAEELRDKVREVWERMEQARIDGWVDGMVERLMRVVKAEGGMIDA